MALLAYLVAALLFVLAAFDVTPGDSTQLEAGLIGLAVFAVAHVLPGDVGAFDRFRGRGE